MDPFDPHGYDKAYASQLGRHSFYNKVSSVPRATHTDTSTTITISSEQAKTLVSAVLRVIFQLFVNYALYTGLLWCALAYLPWIRISLAFEVLLDARSKEISRQLRAGVQGLTNLLVLLAVLLFQAIAQNRRARLARHALRVCAAWIWRTIIRLSDSLRHCSFFAARYIYYQGMFNWCWRHKLRMAFCILGIHILSTMIKSQTDETIDVFMEWTQLQRYIGDPIPGYLFQQRLEYGSNSHYHSTDEVLPTVGEPISGATTTTTISEEITILPAVVSEKESAPPEAEMAGPISAMPSEALRLDDATVETESGREEVIQGGGILIASTTPVPLRADETLSPAILRREADGRLAFCRHCRQIHCCEVYM